DADVWILVRKSIDESCYRRAGPVAQSAQGACGIARNRRILVSQGPPQRRLNRFCMGRQVNQGIDGAAPDGVRLMPQQVDQQRNGGRTDPPDDFKSDTCRSSCPGLRNRLSKGSERVAPWTRMASAVARTFGSLASRRFAQSRTRAGFL